MPLREPVPLEDHRLFRLLLTAMAVVAVLKFTIGAEIELFGDEAFYWWESRSLALAYSDLPFVTALLVATGTAGLGDTVLGVRLLFMLLGSLLPLAVVYLARPLVGRRDSLWAGMASLCLPMAATLGLLAIPDVVLIVLCTTLLGVFVRALRTDQLRFWALGGVLNALGFCTHYRFVVFIAAAGLFLLLTGKGREQWRRPGLYLALALTLPGLYPLVSFNLAHDFGGVLFHFSDRHSWEFNREGLGFWWQQLLLVTPFLFVALAAGLYRALQRSRDGDWQASLVLIFSLVYILGFGLVNPWADQRSTTLHWPVPGYVFALVLLPATLRHFWRSGSWRPLVVLAPVGGLIVGVGMAIYAAITAWGEHLPHRSPVGAPRRWWAGANWERQPDRV